MQTSPIQAESVSAEKGKSNYPEPFAAIVKGRTKRKLGDIFGLSNFGVNITELDPGSASSVLHYHTVQDEFLYILQGTATVIVGDEEFTIAQGDCIGFKAGTRLGHQLLNRSAEPVIYLEIGDRLPDDEAAYPNTDLQVSMSDQGTWVFSHKDGTRY